jgi:hypothetical protein
VTRIRENKLEKALSKLRHDKQDIHISGEPAIGKTEFLSYLMEDIRQEDGFKVSKIGVGKHDDISTLNRKLLNKVRENCGRVSRLRNRVTSVSLGGPDASIGVGFDDREGDLRKIEKLTNAGFLNRLLDDVVLCIDDVDKVGEEEEVRELLDEISGKLGPGFHLVTSGKMSGGEEAEEIHLSLFTLEQTQKFLEKEFNGIDSDTAEEIHNAVEGHPLYLALLVESSEDEEEITLPENEVRKAVEENYLETLSSEEHEFLRKVAPLPELNEQNCSEVVDDISRTEADEMLRQLEDRVIIQRVNRTSGGIAVYKMHERFREVLSERHENQEGVHRRAFIHNTKQVDEALREKEHDEFVEAIPHTMRAKYHLRSIYEEEFEPEKFSTELDHVGIEYPQRGLLTIYAGGMMFNKSMIELLEAELPYFEDWVYDVARSEQQAELCVQLCNWGLSQMTDEEPMDISDIEIEGNIEEIPMETGVLESDNLSDEETQRFKKQYQQFLSYFFTNEHYDKKKHRKLVESSIGNYGINLDLFFNFKDRCISVIAESGIGDEFSRMVDDFEESVEKHLDSSLDSQLDYHEATEEALEISRELAEELYSDYAFNSGLAENLGRAGGEELEEAENPAFAMVWYGIFTAYLWNTNPESDVFEEMKSKYEEMVEERKKYEQKEGIESSPISADKGFIELEDDG